MRPMLYDYTTTSAESVRSETDAAVGRADALVAESVAAAPSFDATLLPLERAAADLVGAYGRGAFLGQVHTEADVRDAGTEAEERLNKWRVAVAFRSDLYEAVRAFADTDEARALEGERARLLAHWLRDFRRAGHELSAKDRAELERLPPGGSRSRSRSSATSTSTATASRSPGSSWRDCPTTTSSGSLRARSPTRTA